MKTDQLATGSATGPSSAVATPSPTASAPVEPVLAKKSAAKKAPNRRTPKAPVVVDPEDAWTLEELVEVKTGLQGQAEELRVEIEQAENVSAALQRSNSGEGSGDEADAGSKTFEREHEMSIANNSRDLLTQVNRALGQIEAGTYGLCEICGNPIAKARLQAFPRATLCVKDKEREERR